MDWRPVTISVLVILAIGLALYFFTTQKPIEVPDFSKEGNLIKDNPGLTPGVWYLSYESSGAPALAKKLQFDAQSKCGAVGELKTCDQLFSQGQQARVEGVENGDTIQIQTLTFIESPETGTTIRLYYYNPSKDQGPGGAQCSKNGLVSVERVIPKTTTPLTESIKLLLRGEISPDEKAQGITSEFPLDGVTLTSASIQNGVAILTFSDPQNKTGGGSCRVAVLWAQIEATAKQFGTVNSVRFLPEELFQP